MVAILVLNYNNFSDTLICLESLTKLNNNNYSVFIIDNCSNDNSDLKFKSWAENFLNEDTFYFFDESDNFNADTFSRFNFIKLHKNYGYAGGNNFVIKLLMNNKSFEFIWILNNDTYVHVDSLDYLLEKFKEIPRLGICGSTLFDFRGNSLTNNLQGYFGSYNLFFGTSKNVKSIKSSILHNHKFNIHYIVGASILIKSDVITQIGYLNDLYFLYNEDVDFSYRVSKKYLLAVSEHSIVYHKVGGTTNNGNKSKSALSEFYYTRNRILFSRLNCKYFLISNILASFYTAGKRIFQFRFKNSFIVLKAINNALNEKIS